MMCQASIFTVSSKLDMAGMGNLAGKTVHQNHAGLSEGAMLQRFSPEKITQSIGVLDFGASAYRGDGCGVAFLFTVGRITFTSTASDWPRILPSLSITSIVML